MKVCIYNRQNQLIVEEVGNPSRVNIKFPAARNIFEMSKLTDFFEAETYTSYAACYAMLDEQMNFLYYVKS